MAISLKIHIANRTEKLNLKSLHHNQIFKNLNDCPSNKNNFNHDKQLWELKLNATSTA